MMFPRLVGLSLLVTLTGCGVVEPDPNGHIVARCSIAPDGDASAGSMCPVGFFALCRLNTDAGNGEVFARCCPDSLSDQACALRAGLVSDASTAQ